MTRGEKVAAFIETYCRVPEGDLIGKPIHLEDFQRKFLYEVYDNPYGTHTGILSIAKKNGKTGFIAGILLAHVAGPEACLNTQIVSGAQSKDQAAVIFKLSAKMVNMNEKLAKMIRIVPSTKILIGLARNTEYKALSAEAKNTHGISPKLAILDEVGQVVGPHDDFISAVTTSQGAYSDALLLAISTQAPNDSDLFSIWIDSQKNAPDPRVVCHVYQAPEDCKLDDRKAWYAANPALGIFKSINDLEKKSRIAIEMPSTEAEFRNFSLNQRVEASSPFIPRSVWESNGDDPGPLEGKKVWGGLDLSSTSDLTALVLVDEEGGVHSTFWLPNTGLKEKAKKDRVPYDLWQKSSLLQTTPGKSIEYEFVAEYLRGVFDRCDIQSIGFDRYNMKFLKPWLEKANFSERELEKFVEFGQGFASMTPALRELETRALNAKLKHGNNPILTMCNANARVVGESGARKLDKKKTRGRIDGMVALTMAIGVMPSTADAPKFQLYFA